MNIFTHDATRGKDRYDEAHAEGVPARQSLGIFCGILGPSRGSEVWDLGSGIRDPGSQIQDPRSGIRDLGSGIWDAGPGIWDPGFGIRDLRSGI